MSRTQWLLVALIALELAAGGFLVARRWNRSTPPVPDLADTDPVTAGEIRDLGANCRTAGDWARLGEVYLATGFFPEAEACLRRACELDAEQVEYRFRHAFALERIGRIEEANQEYEAAARNSARAADCWYYIGRNHLRLEAPGPAAEAFGRARDLPGAQYELARLDARAGRAAEADAVAARLTAEHPNAYPPVSLRYRLALARGEGEGAAANQFADQFARRPRPLPTPFDTEVKWIFGIADGVGRARLFRDAGRDAQAGRLNQAENKLRDALAARWDPRIAYRLAQTMFQLGLTEEARRILTETVERDGPSMELLWGLGKAEAALGRPEKTLALWQRASRLASGNQAGDIWDDLANAYERSGRGEDAKAASARGQFLAGLDALDRGDLNEARIRFERAVKADPRLTRAWFFLGEAHRFAGRTAEARAAYDRCLELDPNYGRASRALRLLEIP